MRVLLVDDDPGALSLMRLALERRGHEVTAVRSAETALETMRQEPYPLILLDWMLPGVDGLELCRHIRALPHGERPVILIVAARVGREDLTTALAAGANDYLTKPVDVDLLEVRLAVAERHVQDVAELKAAETRLVETEAKYRTLVEQLRGITYIASAEPPVRTLFVSPHIATVLGYSQGESYANPHLWEQCLYPDDRDRVLRERAQSLANGEPFRSEYRILTRDGRVLWFQDQAVLVRGEDGQAVQIHGHLLDVTERKQAEEERALALARERAARAEAVAARERYRQLMERLDVVVWEADAQTFDFTFVSQGAESLLGYPIDWWLKTPNFWTHLIHPEDQAHVFEISGKCVAEGRGLSLEYRMLAADGRTVWVREVAHVTLDRNGHAQHLRGVLVDISDRKQAEEERTRLYHELAERERQLQELVGRLLLAQEEERRRVAYEIHDGLAQTAVGAQQHLEAYAAHWWPGAPEAGWELGRSLELAQLVVEEARRVIAGLRPTSLDDFGLATALRLEIEGLRADGLEIAYDERLGGERLPPMVETALFRVAQEALRNFRKHAGSLRARVQLLRRGRTVRLTVRDWGRGFDASAPPGEQVGPGERVGLPGMRERVALLGGRCVIRSRPNWGTHVIVEVSLPVHAIATGPYANGVAHG